MFAVNDSTVMFAVNVSTVKFVVNANRYLPKFPAISLSQQIDKQTQKDLERNAFVLH